MKKRLVLGCLLIVSIGLQFLGMFLFLSFDSSENDLGMSMQGSSVVIFTANGYTDEDLRNVSQFFDDRGASVTIAGLTTNVTSMKGITITSDMLLSDIMNVTVFNAVFIPGGEITSVLIADQHVKDLLEKANETELVIASLSNGTLVQAAAGLLMGKNFTTHSTLVTNLTSTGGNYVGNKTVITDGNIITGISPNFEEIGYAIANGLGFSYQLTVDISFEKNDQGWNYTVTVDVSDKKIVDQMAVNLSISNNGNDKTFVEAIKLMKAGQGSFSGNLGVLANNYYTIDLIAESIYGTIETRTDVTEFSVGSN